MYAELTVHLPTSCTLTPLVYFIFPSRGIALMLTGWFRVFATFASGLYLGQVDMPQRAGGKYKNGQTLRIRTCRGMKMSRYFARCHSCHLQGI